MKKRLSTDLVEKYLDRYGWPRHETAPQPPEAEGIVLTGWASPLSPEGQPLWIDPLREQRGLRFTAKHIAEAPPDGTPSDRLRALLFAMAAINHRLVLGAFALDPETGEVVFKLGIPTDADDLRYDEFAHCLDVVRGTVDLHGDTLRGLVDGTKTLQDVIVLP